MARWGLIALLLCICATLWWYQGVATSYRMFGGSLAVLLDVAASLVTAVLGVIVVAETAIGVIVIVLLGAQPTGFERAGIYAVLTVAGAGLVLSHFGVNVSTVLATSALLTAIVGLALQPTLGALIAGFTLNADRVLRIGDGIIQNGEAVTVTSIGWRSVAGLKGDGTRVVISNSRVLDGAVDILPAATPVRTETVILAPLAGEPERIADLCGGIVADLPMVDVTRPIHVGVLAFEPEKAQARYRIRCWVRSHLDRAAVEEQILARLWYAFQRQDLPWPMPSALAADYAAWRPSLGSPIWQDVLATAHEQVKWRHPAAPLSALSIEQISEAGALLLYADGERILMPGRVAGSRCLLIRGRVREIAFELAGLTGGTEDLPSQTGQGSRRVALKQLAARLADLIGPFAEVAVQRAASAEADIRKVRGIVAREIPDAAERENFASQDVEGLEDRHGPGYEFGLRRGATGALQPDPLLSADGPAAIVAVPGALLAARG